MKRSLIPDPIRGLLDIQVAGEEKPKSDEVGGYAIDEPKIKTFYDPDFSTEAPANEILTIYNSKRYDKKVPELKQMCRDRNLAVGGKKKELIDRLHEHTQKIKKEKLEEELKVQQEERVGVNKHQDNALLKIKNNIKRLTRVRLKLLDELVEAQQKFDATEAELNEMKSTLKSLEKVL